MGCEVTYIEGPSANRIEQMSTKEYRSLLRMNPSTLVHGLRGRAVDPYAVKLAYESEDRTFAAATQDRMDRGTLAHLLILEPHRVDDEVAVWSGGTRRGSIWDAFEDANQGKLIIKESDYDEVRRGCEVASANQRVRELFAGGQVEAAILAEEGSLKCKGRVDFISTPSPLGLVTIPDLKTTEAGIDEESVTRTIRSQHYREKMALYRRWASAAHGVPKENYRCFNVFVKLSQPYGVHIVQLLSDGLERAEKRMMAVIEEYSRCVESGVWKPFFAETGFGMTNWEMTEEENLSWENVSE